MGNKAIHPEDILNRWLVHHRPFILSENPYKLTCNWQRKQKASRGTHTIMWRTCNSARNAKYKNVAKHLGFRQRCQCRQNIQLVSHQRASRYKICCKAAGWNPDGISCTSCGVNKIRRQSGLTIIYIYKVTFHSTTLTSHQGLWVFLAESLIQLLRGLRF